jgi:predicted MFS family arabinose efflux permease
MFAANMTLNLYIAPIVRVGAGVVGAGVGVFQAMIGVGSILGLSLGGRAADRGAGKAWVLQGFVIQGVAMSLHFSATHHVAAAGWPSWILVASAIVVAASALFSVTPVIQTRLIQATEGAPVALALNGSVIALGQATGASLGGFSLHAWGVPAIPGTALVMSLVALSILSVAFPRRRPA